MAEPAGKSTRAEPIEGCARGGRRRISFSGRERRVVRRTGSTYEQNRISGVDCVAEDVPGRALGVSGQVPHLSLAVADPEFAPFLVQLVERILEFLHRDLVQFRKVGLSLAHGAVGTDRDSSGRCGGEGFDFRVERGGVASEAELEVRGSGQVIGVGVRFEDPLDADVLLLGKGE